MSDTQSSAPAKVMSAGEATMWETAAAELHPHKMLARAMEHQKAVVTTVATVGTLLAGLGGVTAAITFDGGPSWAGISLVPLLTLAVSVLAGSAVLTALIARRPTFQMLNIHNLLSVQDYYRTELARRSVSLRISSGLLLGAASLAVLVAFLAGVNTLLPDGPRNQASLSTSVGAGGVVTVTLGGAVEQVKDGEHVRVEISDGQAGSLLVDQTVYPDGAGKAAVSAQTVAPAGSTSVVATLQVLGPDAQPTTRFTLSATHPPVPDAAETAP